MRKPIKPERAKKLTDNLRELTGKADDAGQNAAGDFLRGILPFENDSSSPTSRKTATIPLPNDDTAGISYDPAKPNDFGFTVTDPTGEPKSVPGVRGMENGNTQATLRPLEVGPAIEKAGGISKTTQFAMRLGTTTGDRTVGH